MYQFNEFPKLKALKPQFVAAMPQRIVSENSGQKVEFKNGISGAVFSRGFTHIPFLDAPAGYQTILAQHKSDPLIWIVVFAEI